MREDEAGQFRVDGCFKTGQFLGAGRMFRTRQLIIDATERSGRWYEISGGVVRGEEAPPPRPTPIGVLDFLEGIGQLHHLQKSVRHFFRDAGVVVHFPAVPTIPSVFPTFVPLYGRHWIRIVRPCGFPRYDEWIQKFGSEDVWEDLLFDNTKKEKLTAAQEKHLLEAQRREWS